jgi:hypothetical protein
MNMVAIAIWKASKYHSTFNSKVSSNRSSQRPFPSFSRFLLFYKFRCCMSLQYGNIVKPEHSIPALSDILLGYQVKTLESINSIKMKKWKYFSIQCIPLSERKLFLESSHAFPFVLLLNEACGLSWMYSIGGMTLTDANRVGESPVPMPLHQP